MSPPAGRPILRVGLTGGIASGKTVVATLLAERGAFVLDADRTVHALLEPGGGAHREVVARFGRGILDAGGRIDRARLGAIVFSDPEARTALNSIVHPKVVAEIGRRLADHEVSESPSPLAVVDAALLVETGLNRSFHRIVVVSCGREKQLERLLGRGMSRADAEARLAAQAPDEVKVAEADYVVDGSGSLEDARRQVADLHAALLEDHEEEFGRSPPSR